MRKYWTLFIPMNRRSSMCPWSYRGKREILFLRPRTKKAKQNYIGTWTTNTQALLKIFINSRSIPLSENMSSPSWTKQEIPPADNLRFWRRPDEFNYLRGLLNRAF